MKSPGREAPDSTSRPAGAPRSAWADTVRGVILGTVAAAAAYPFVSHGVHAAKPARAQPGPAVAAALPPARLAEFNGTVPTVPVEQVADWVADSNDNHGLAFAILDKQDARVYVFDRGAHLIGASPVLLGAAVGDDSAPGIGQRPIAQVRPSEKTTPAGRFDTRPGHNAGGEDVVWVDYDAAVSMHRVRVVDPKEHRLERLATPTPADNRISYGCINVPVAFFNTIVHPMLARGPAVVYVLPETRPLRSTFPLYDVNAHQAHRGPMDS